VTLSLDAKTKESERVGVEYRKHNFHSSKQVSEAVTHVKFLMVNNIAKLNKLFFWQQICEKVYSGCS